MASPSGDDPTGWNPTTFIAIDDHPSSPPPSKRQRISPPPGDIQVNTAPLVTPAPYTHHAPISFSSAFNAASRGRGQSKKNSSASGSGIVTPRYANQFASDQALFPFGGGATGNHGSGVGGVGVADRNDPAIPVVGSDGTTSAFPNDGVSGHAGASNDFTDFPVVNAGDVQVGDGSAGVIHMNNPYNLPTSYEPEIIVNSPPVLTGQAVRGHGNLPSRQRRHNYVEDDLVVQEDLGSSTQTPSRAPKSGKAARTQSTKKGRKSRGTENSSGHVTPDPFAGGEGLPVVQVAARLQRDTMNDAKRRKPIKKNQIIKPRIPSAFEDPGNERAAMLLEQGLNPDTVKALLPLIKDHSKLYRAAYNALNDEVIKCQIEESVLKNIKLTAQNKIQAIRRAAEKV